MLINSIKRKGEDHFMSGIHGDKIKMAIFGESHGTAVGLVIDGLPAGISIDLTAVAKEMKRRAPGQNLMSTPRKESDEFLIQSGFFEGKTTGTPLCALIPNSDTRSGDYSLLKDVMRPGHADYSGKIKYHGFNDYRGGGHFSGRLTAPLVFIGALSKQILALQGVQVGAHIAAIGGIEDTRFNLLGEESSTLETVSQKTMAVLDDEQGKKMQDLIMEVREQADSIGGSIECMVLGLPAGIGAPFFDSVESRLSHALFSVPAVKGLEFGAGFALAAMRGSEANDQLYLEGDKVKTRTNNNGGILGGITNGMPVVFKVGIKPTPSIGQAQSTVNMAKKENTTLLIAGRHDPCIVQRAVPVIEGVTAWIILDMLLTSDVE